MRGPRCCSGFTLVLASRGYSPVVVCGLLLLWLLSLLNTGCNSCGSPALVHRLNGCGAPAYVLRGMWDLPRSGIEPVFPALAGGFFTTEPPGKPHVFILHFWLCPGFTAMHRSFSVMECELLWLWGAGSAVAVHGLSCPAACRIFAPQPGIKPCIGRWILNHWTSRDVCPP